MKTTNLDDVCAALETIAPLCLAEEWDNVGLLVGDRKKPLSNIMTCLTITPESATEAIEREVGLIVTHHPLPFQPLSRITTDSIAGQLLLQLIQAGVAIYSAHTAYDSAACGINQSLAEGLGLIDIEPLIPDESNTLGTGRQGCMQEKSTLAELAQSLQQFLGNTGMKIVGNDAQPVSRVSVACGSAGSLFDAAYQADCDAMILGEANFHTCLEAKARGIGLLLTGHYASERFALENLATTLADTFPEIQVWPSAREADPLRSWGG